MKNWLIQTGRVSALLLGALLLFSGCESKGPAEKAGEQIDQGVQDAKDAVNPQGPAERAGEALDKAGDRIEEGAQNVKDAIDPPGPAEQVGREVDKATKP